MIQTTVAPAVDNVDFHSERRETPPLSSSPARNTPPDSPSARSSPIKTPSPIKKKTSSPPRYLTTLSFYTRNNLNIFK